MSWSKPADGSRVRIPDPSKRSILFSLANATGSQHWSPLDDRRTIICHREWFSFGPLVFSVYNEPMHSVGANSVDDNAAKDRPATSAKKKATDPFFFTAKSLVGSDNGWFACDEMEVYTV